MSPFFFFKPRIAAVECQVQTPIKAKTLSFDEEMNISPCVSRDKVMVTAIVLHHIKLPTKEYPRFDKSRGFSTIVDHPSKW